MSIGIIKNPRTAILLVNTLKFKGKSEDTSLTLDEFMRCF
jgi:hypothetical protein